MSDGSVCGGQMRMTVFQTGGSEERAVPSRGTAGKRTGTGIWACQSWAVLLVPVRQGLVRGSQPQDNFLGKKGRAGNLCSLPPEHAWAQWPRESVPAQYQRRMDSLQFILSLSGTQTLSRGGVGAFWRKEEASG